MNMQQESDQESIYMSRLALFWAPATRRENDMPATIAKFKESKVT